MCARVCVRMCVFQYWRGACVRRVCRNVCRGVCRGACTGVCIHIQNYVCDEGSVNGDGAVDF